MPEPTSFLDSAPTRQAERAAHAERQERRRKLGSAVESLRHGGGGRTWNVVDGRPEMAADLAEWVRRSVEMAADYKVGGLWDAVLAAAGGPQVGNVARRATRDLVAAAVACDQDAAHRIAGQIQAEGLTAAVYSVFADACGQLAVHFSARWQPPADDDPQKAGELASVLRAIDKWDGRLALLFRPPTPPEGAEQAERIDGALTRRGMEQIISGGRQSVILHHPRYPNGSAIVTRVEDLPGEEELALTRPDRWEARTPAGYADWCDRQAQKLVTLVGQYPDLGNRGAANPAGGFVRVARQHGIRLDPEAAVAAGNLFREPGRWPGDDPFEAIDLLNELAAWARRLAAGQPAGEDAGPPPQPTPAEAPMLAPPSSLVGLAGRAAELMERLFRDRGVPDADRLAQLPRFGLFWEDMHRLGARDIPSFPGEPTTGAQALGMLAQVIGVCRETVEWARRVNDAMDETLAVIKMPPQSGDAIAPAAVAPTAVRSDVAADPRQGRTLDGVPQTTGRPLTSAVPIPQVGNVVRPELKIESNAQGADSAEPTAKRRGPKQKFDPEVDEAYLRKWATAQAQGKSVLQFEEENGDPPGTVERTQARVRNRSRTGPK